jgi:MFS family permease
MSQRNIDHRGQSDTEETPLLVPGPSAADASAEAALVQNTSSGHLKTPSNGHIGPKDDGQTTANQSLTLIRGILSILGLGGLILLQATNISILTTTQSAIAVDLDAFERTSWFTSAYLIAMSALGPLNGKLAAVFTPRITIFASSILLATGVIISGLATTFESFITGRVFTGIGAAGIFTVSIIIVLELTGSKRRGLAIGLLNTGFTIGVAVGATAAGALLPHTGWRWLFLGQAPIALLGGTCLLLSIPSTFSAGGGDNSKSSPKPLLTRLAGLDYLGAILLTASITLCLYSLGSSPHIPLLPLLLSPFVLAAFILNELYLATDPIIPLALLRSRGLLFTCLATVGYMMARWSVLFYTPTYAIAVRAWSPATAGAILVPTNGGFALGGLLVGWLHIRRQGSFYLPTLAVYIINPFTLVILVALLTDHSNIALFVLDLVVSGAVTGAALNYNLAHLLHLTPKSTHYVATSLLATFRGFSGSFGSAIGGGLFSRTLYNSLTRQFSDLRSSPIHSSHASSAEHEDLIRRLLGSPALVQRLEGVEHAIAVKGYEEALRTLFLSGAALAALMIFVQASVGWKGAGEEEALIREAGRVEEREHEERED